MADMVSQDEINALLGSVDSGAKTEEETTGLLTPKERDVLGEIGNISMGTAATTLYTLLGHKVVITTPRVSEKSFVDLVSTFDNPCVTIKVEYTVGLEGQNVLVMNERDVKVITDLMMGGDGSNIAETLEELHLSAIGEAMNQMIGSASTSISEMIGRKVDISPPETIYDDLENLTQDVVGIDPEEKIILIAFAMKVGDLIDSEIFQLMPVKTAKQLVSNLHEEEKPAAPAPAPAAAAPAPAPTPTAAPAPAPAPAAPAPAPVYQAPPQQAQAINAQNVQFQNFGQGNVEGVNGDISLIQEVPLEITVELGRTSRKISEILDFSAGSVVELDRIVGESLDILANGRVIAKGEVVVVDENYGVRITEIVIPQHRWGAN